MKDQFVDIEAYLDGRMTLAERIDFEEKLKQDAVLRSTLDEIRELRENLAWHFASEDVATAARLRRETQKRRWKRLVFLLCLLAVSLAGFLIWWKTRASDTGPQQPLPVLQPPAGPPAPVQDVAPPLPSGKTMPMADQLTKQKTEDKYRDLPKENVPDEYRQFFEQQMRGFTPVVESKGIWAPAVEALAKRLPAKADKLLRNLPTQWASNDTTLYLQAVVDLQLERPSAAENRLYPLITNKKWQTEGQYLLVWVYLLKGDAELSQSALKLVPDDYRDKKAIAAFLE